MTDVIWKRVYQCAQELTSKGVTPFTRGDLIRCVQRDDPDCSPDSINPIIQGMTDNLRGGAPGAVGKNLLHSLSRGHFVLNEAVPRSPEKPQAKIPARPTAREVEGEKRQSAGLGHEILEIGGYDFKYICEIEPERNDDGTVRMLAPQDRYENTGYLTLNRYGAGPFCKFKIPWNISKCGVYALVVDEQIHYVGETENLSNRFNMGYGNISPRNCFAGGQETNCRINSLIFDKLSEGCRVTLWFHTTDEYKKVESALREIGAFGWNRV